MQLLAQELGGGVAPAERREYGPVELHIEDATSPLIAALPFSQVVWMSHGDRIEELPPGFVALAYTENSPFAAVMATLRSERRSSSARTLSAS